MPFPMRIKPMDFGESSIRYDVVKAPVLKSRLKRFFDRPFNGVLKISSADKPAIGTTAAEFEPSSVCLDKMVQNFMEDNNEKHHTSAASAVKCGRNRCNCFNGNSNDSSDDEFDFFSDPATAANSSFNDPSDALNSLVPCATMAEKNLLADTSNIVEKNRGCKSKNNLRKLVTGGLIALDYDASICKSTWEKSSSIPAGEYEYIDVIIEGERILIDVDFRSEFEIARSTGSYKAILQCLPYIFVGKTDRLVPIISLVSEAARQSLKKKDMHIAPWRKAEYVKSKWLGPHARITKLKSDNKPTQETDNNREIEPGNPEVMGVLNTEIGELDFIFGEKTLSTEGSNIEESKSPVKQVIPPVAWQLPAVRPKSIERGNRVVVTGLASLLK